MVRKKVKNWKPPKKIFGLFLIIIIALYVQYGYLSLSKTVYGTNMKQFASSRNTTTTQLFAKRGTIYDANENTLALNIASYTLIAYLDSSRTVDKKNPKHVVDKEYTASKLSEMLNADYDYILDRLNKKSYQVEFGNYGRNITELTKLEIEKLNLPGIEFKETTTRYYPNGNFGSYIIGYAKSNDDGVIEGKLGIESAYDELLKGTDGYYKYQQDKQGYKIPETPEVRVESIDGSDIYLTINSDIQRFAESAINGIMNYNPEWAIISVMDAKTGEILASATTPSYDPNNIPSDMSYQNPLVSYSFEPGSTMKIYTYMCAIDKGVYDGNTEFESGSYQVLDDTIRDWNGTGWGIINYDTGFEYSSNVAVVNIIKNYLTRKELNDCFKKYGFGEKTGIDLPNEASGNIDFRYEIEVLAAGYGQGISTTPIQHLQALSIIANNGYMIKPHVISKIVDANGEKNVTKISKSEKLVNDSTITKIKSLMRNVIASESGTGHKYDIENYNIIGKTGTAQIYENGSYLADKYILSSALIYPQDDPEIIIYAAAKKPSENSTNVLSDSIKELMKNIAKYKNMFDSNKVESNIEKITIGSYISKNVFDVKNQLEEKGIKVIIMGDGNDIIDQYPSSGIDIISSDYVFLLTNGDNNIMPNMLGWSRSDVLAFCKLSNVNCTINGSGYVSSQSINEGNIVAGDITVEMSSR